MASCCREEKKFRRNEGKKSKSICRGKSWQRVNSPSIALPRSMAARAEDDTSRFRRGSARREKTGAWQGREGLRRTTTTASSSSLLPSSSPASPCSSSRTRRRRRKTRRIRWRCARSILRQGAQRLTRGLRKGSSSEGLARGSNPEEKMSYSIFFFRATFKCESENERSRKEKQPTFSSDSDPVTRHFSFCDVSGPFRALHES